eukprot:CAMPEP_0172309492 /NCGR_PEP_ID=MMETSP1058-20130122/9757_1 /TAXON_ID=83371 /ORGANISM="Detonula confervacea, Strain CCMP 353" /LENGTH=256 /DNA_ID=CAMNT_0013022121 /DNA_START=119 /DNA_END=889 /DNA_ORIENTATION=+
MPTVFAFAPSAMQQAHFVRACRIQSSNNLDGDDFDPFLSSPHSFGSTDDDNSDDDDSTFGFLSYAQTNVGAMSNPESPLDDTTTTGLDLDEFDPLLSPHAYANGVDAAPTVDSGPTIATEKLGILLIDHGSKRQASNDHIMDVAKMFENILNQKKTTTIVRAAHMEIAPPFIIDSLRDIITVDKVTKIVCVPYFLSPGRHATEDVPELIAEARGILAEEGLLNDILVSKALGTHLESMLGAVDVLVESALDEAERE